MAGAVNSDSLGKKTINAGGSVTVAAAAALAMEVTHAAFAIKREIIEAEISFGFDIDGGSDRRVARATLAPVFSSMVYVSRLNTAKVQEITLPFNMMNAANQRMVATTMAAAPKIATDMRQTSTMQFAHLNQAPHGRVMLVEADMRTSTLDKEQG